MPMRTIDLNADLGEGGLQDAAIIALVTSANIACGGHAGDEKTMRTAIDACLAAGVAIGAHPGYEDREYFGRRALEISPGAVTDLVARQVARLADMTPLHHVKPHGALYHQADHDPKLAAAVTQGVASVLPGGMIYAPPGGALAAAARIAGLQVCAEGFIDRRYSENGDLVPRKNADAMIEDVRMAVAQAMQIACKSQVETTAGTWLSLPGETLCIHGDSPHATETLRALHHALNTAGIQLQAPSMSHVRH